MTTNGISSAGTISGNGTSDCKEPPWLVMVFLAGDNFLTEEMVSALLALKEDGPPEGDKFVAQLDPSGSGLPTQTYDFSEIGPDGSLLISKSARKIAGNLHEQLASFAVQEINTGDPRILSDFINWADNRYDPENEGKYRRMLIISGHGGGTIGDYLATDDTSMDGLTIDELKTALANTQSTLEDRKLDILGMDACFMSMGEVCYEIREHVDIMIGAEGLEPDFGWPYSRILKRAKNHRVTSGGTPMTPPELAEAIVEEYVEHYSDHDRAAGRSVDLAAIRLDKMEGLSEAVANLGRELLVAIGNKELKNSLSDKDLGALLLAHWNAQTYKFDQYVDLHDFSVQAYRLFGKESPIGIASEQVVTTLDGTRVSLDAVDAGKFAHETGPFSSQKGCIILSGCSGFAYQHSYGLSVYMPWALVSPDYAGLTFAKKSGSEPDEGPGWGDFLEKFVQATRREPRFNEGGAGLTEVDQAAIEAISAVAYRLKVECVEKAWAGAEGLFDGTRFGEVLAHELLNESFLHEHFPHEDFPRGDFFAREPLERARSAVCDDVLEAMRRAVRAAVADKVEDIKKKLVKMDIPFEDYPEEISNRLFLSVGFGAHNSKFTMRGSRFTMRGSRFTMRGSRYPGDRENSVKNLPPVIGKAYWPPKK